MYDKIMVIGDVHGDFAQLSKAIQFALDTGSFMVFLGDVIDNGHDNWKCVRTVLNLVRENMAAFVIGNHDKKAYKYFSKRLNDDYYKMKIRHGMETTVAEFESLSAADKLDFINDLFRLVEGGKYIQNFGNLFCVHAALSHSDIENVDNPNSGLCLYGEVLRGEMTADGYPVRKYNWVNRVPAGSYVVFGHDILGTSPSFLRSDYATVLSLDTGCGKGGKLSVALFENRDNKYVLVELRTFL